MAVQQYSPVNWTNEHVDLDKLKQMTNNDQFIFESLPQMLYKGSINKSNGLKIACGKTYLPRRPNIFENFMEVSFGSFFTVGCAPVVVTTAQGDDDGPAGNLRVVTVSGVGSTEAPDHRGFKIRFTYLDARHHWTRRVDSRGLVHWIAMGW